MINKAVVWRIGDDGPFSITGLHCLLEGMANDGNGSLNASIENLSMDDILLMLKALDTYSALGDIKPLLEKIVEGKVK